MRAQRIKKTYLDTGVFKDNGQFDCGSQLAYEMEEDMRIIKQALWHIDDFLKYYKVKTFGDANLLHAKQLLEKRLNEY